MTKEEAIKKLEWALRNNTIYDVESAWEYICAIKLAIEALQTEPYFWEKCPYYVPDIMFDGEEEYDYGQCKYKLESCDVAISKSEAISKISKYGSVWMEYTDEMSKEEIADRALKASKDAMIRILDELPSVNPQEPKTGHWIKYGIPRCGEQHYKCTNCDEYFNFGLYSDYYKKAFKYCPNCGAEMEGAE